MDGIFKDWEEQVGTGINRGCRLNTLSRDGLLDKEIRQGGASHILMLIRQQEG